MAAPEITNVTIVCIVGPSGSGKTVLSNLLRNDEGYAGITTVTTRAPRAGAGEKHGVHYFFETVDSFKAMKEAGRLVESVTVESKGKVYHYGTPASEVERAAALGKPVALVVDPNGGQDIHRYCEEHGWHGVRVFVNNPIEVLRERLNERYEADLAAIEHPDTAAGRIRASKMREAHEERVAHLEGKEQQEWVKPAHDGRHPYEIVIDRFDASVQDQVVQRINDYVAALQVPKVAFNVEPTVSAPRRPKP